MELYISVLNSRYQVVEFRSLLNCSHICSHCVCMSMCPVVMWCFVLCSEQPLVLPPSLKENLLDFGVRSATHTSSIIFVVVNSNPIEVRSRSTLHVLLRITTNYLTTVRGYFVPEGKFCGGLSCLLHNRLFIV